MVSTLEMEFYCTATTGNLRVVDRYLSETASQPELQRQLVTTQDFAGHSILHGACNVHKAAVVGALMARPAIRRACLNLRDIRYGRTPLQTCLTAGHDDLALLLLQNDDTDVSNRDHDDRTALHLACYYNRSLAVIQALLQKCESKQRNTEDDDETNLIHQRDKYGKTPLLYACDHANVTVVQQLLSTMTTTTTNLVWHWELAHVRGALELPAYQTVAQLVLDTGIPIQPILRCQHPYKIHQELLDWIQKLQNDPAQQVRTAAARGNIPALQSLLDIRPLSRRNDAIGLVVWNTKTRTTLGTHHDEWTALHCAARFGHAAAVGLLLQAGASPWTENGDSTTTPIQVAVQHGHLSVVEEILRHTVV